MITSIGIITLNIECAEKEEEFGANWGDKEAREGEWGVDDITVNLPDKNASKIPDPYNGGLTNETYVYIPWAFIIA